MSSSGSKRDARNQPGELVTSGAVRFGRFARFRPADERPPPDYTLVRRRPLYVVAFALAVMCFVLGEPLLFVAALLILVVAAVPEMWYRFGMNGLVVERKLGATRANIGDVVEVRLLVENRKPLPMPWLEVDDLYPVSLRPFTRRVTASSQPGRATLTQTLALWTYQRVRRRMRFRTTARGVFHFGPLTVSASDPFGMLMREVKLEALESLIVHPVIAPVQRFGLNAQSPFGERKSALRLLEDPLRVAGTRMYTPGDEPRRIHWKATARTGALQSKVYEPSTRHALAIFLEVRTYPRVLMGYDEDIFELIACAAASVANWSLEHGYATGLYSNGTMATLQSSETSTLSGPAGSEAEDDGYSRANEPVSGSPPRLRLPPSSRSEQLTRILDGLARLLPYYGLPMDQVVGTERRRLPMGTTVVYIGTEAAVDVPIIVALRQLQSHGHPVSLLLARSGQAASDDAGEAVHLSGLPIHYIGSREDWRAILREALSDSGEGGTDESIGRPATPDGAATVGTDHVGSSTGESRTAQRAITLE